MNAAALKPARWSISGGADWTTTGAWVRVGNLVVFGCVGGLLLLSAMLSISGAVVASGVVNVEHNYKVVQHLDGGIVDKILVKNGDRVKAGDVLVRLDETVARANLAVTIGRLNDALILQARLEAERDRKDAMALPASIDETKADADLSRIIATQRAMFDARRTSRLGEQGVLRQRFEQLENDVRSLEAQHKSRERELEIAAKELKGLVPLYEKGFVNQGRIGPVQREVTRLEGEVSRLVSDIAKAKGAVAEVELKIAQSEKDFTQSVVDELRKAQSSVAELVETRTALEDKLRRTVIRAPRPGRVHALAVHTEGGVIQPAGQVMQIIPEDERLIIDAQIATADVDKVRKGQTGIVRFPAFNARTTPRLEIRVVSVSPAQVTDAQGRSFFTVQVELAADQLASLGSGHELVPGMPAEVYIETEQRSILSYFVKPLADALSRAFRER